VNVIVIDTEGLGDTNNNQNIDLKIFTFAVLLSSCFIYNSVGTIDADSIKSLSLVAKMSEHIQLSTADHH
jgi:hypothetical protein